MAWRVSASQLEEAVRLLSAGRLVAIPTETVYGLAANAMDALAVARIFEAKGRPHFDPLIVHAAGTEQALSLASDCPPLARRLAEHFWPGPLTLVLPKVPQIPELVTSGLPSVALRVPAHPLTLQLLRLFGGPLAAPSANRFGRISPTTAEHVRSELGEAVSLVLDGGPCETGVESTIVSFVTGRPVLLRPGGLPLEALQELVGPLEVPAIDPAHPMAPGQLPSHYAPHTPLFLATAEAPPEAAGRKPGLLLIGPGRVVSGYELIEVLSPSGDLREAAAGLFAALRRLDAAGLTGIVAELTTDHGLGRAINDRLTRASRR
jgi:L-threonylcarbamoyladenylate synthase